MRYCNILVGGFFLTMLIRELDALFDLISHGSWVWFALITALLALIRPVMHFRATLEQLAKYTQSPWYGILLSGLLAVLVFSRLFGMQVLWHAILEHGYMRVVKTPWRKVRNRSAICCAWPHPLAITLPFALTQERNSLFPLRRQRRRGKYLSTPSLGRYGGHVRKTYPKKR